MVASVCLILLFAVSLPGAYTLQWSYTPQDGGLVTACAGGTLSLPWDITLSSGESIVDIQWLFEGRSSELIAMYARGHFAPMVPYSQRVQLVGDTGLSISHVVEGDSGNYSVEVTAHGASGTVYTLRHTAIVRIYTEISATTDAIVRVVQDTSAVYDYATRQYHIQLTCTSRGQPPYSIDWTTPDGAFSARSSNGQFHFLVPNPVTGGNYSCRVASDVPAVSCLSSNNPVRHGDTVFVDRVEARLAVLEAENNNLKSQVSTLNSYNSVLENKVRQLQAAVSFYAQYTGSSGLTGITLLSSWNVVTNQGGAFSGSTGIFTTPYSGNYFFIAVTTPSTGDLTSGMSVVRDGSNVANIHSDNAHAGEVMTVQTVVHLTVGSRVWLATNGNGYYHTTLTTFSGFLINSD